MKLLLSLFAAIMIHSSVNADSGKTNTNVPEAPKAITAVSGTVTDAITGEALAGAAVEIENTDIRVFTDLEGKFQFDQLNVGTYSIKVKYISYQDKALKELVFKQEKSNLNIQLDSK